MTLSLSQQDKLQDLIDAACENDPAPAVLERLESLLLSDDDACRYYLDYVSLHGALILASEKKPTTDVFELEIQRSEIRKSQIPNQQIPNLPSPILSIPSPVILDTSDSLSPLAPAPSPFYVAHPFVFSNLFAIAVISLGALGAWFYQVDIPHPLAAKDRPATSFNKTAKSAADDRLEFVGRVTGMVDVQWADVQTSTVHGANVSLGRKFALASGLMEITYNTGAKVILQGPVTYEVDSLAGGFLSVGKLTAKLEKRAESREKSPEKPSAVSDQQSEKVASGQWPVDSESDPKSRNPQIPKSPISSPQSPAPMFVVRTPTATVTDLGTEFGVHVDKRGRTEAYVFVGAVKIAAISEQGNETAQSQTLHAGQYASVNANQAIVTGERDFEKIGKRFVRTMPKPQNMARSYADLVLSMNPVVYYRMDQWPKAEGENRYVLVDSAPGGHNGVARLDPAFGKPSSPGKFGAALDLHGSGSGECAFVGDYPKTQDDRLSVSAWVKPITVEAWAMILGNIYLRYSADSQIVERQGQFSIGVNGTCELYAGLRQRDNGSLGLSEQGRVLTRGVWHHVALVADGTVLHLYHNGAEVATAPYHGIVRQTAYSRLNVGCRQIEKAGRASQLQNSFHWNGWIDEAAIFNHALRADQIHQLFAGCVVTK